MLRFMHEDSHTDPFNYQPDVGGYMATPSGAFGIAQKMHECPWCEIEPVIEIYLREVIRGYFHGRWKVEDSSGTLVYEDEIDE